MSSATSEPIVLDNGTGVLKAGFAGADRPRVVYQACVGTPRYDRALPGGVLDGVTHVIGDEAVKHRGCLCLSYPMEHGVVQNWDDMEKVWAGVYARQGGLGVPSDEHPLLLTEPALNPYSHREKAAQVLFEEMRVPALFVAPQAILSLYSSGRTTGLVLDCGDGVSHAVPVYQGFALRHAITRVDVAGRDVTERLMLLARRAGVSLTSSAERELARTIKEEHCYVALDAAREEHSPSRPAAAYTLPDGTPLTLGAERFRAPEALFDSSLVGVEASGVQGCVLDAVRKSDLELRQHLLSQVVLAGGSTLYPGFGERLLAEVRKGSPAGVKVRIAAPPERKFMTWIGGSILASLATFKRMWVSKADYDEHGARILNDRSL